MDRRASTKALTEKELQRIAENLSDIEDDIADFESESEGEEEVIEEDCYNSESEQSTDEFSKETESFVRPNESERFYIGKNEETIWKSTPVIQGNKPKATNIIKVLPGSKGAAKNVSKPLDSFFMFLTRDMVDHIVLCTNIYIENKRDNFIRDRDCKLTSSEEMSALFGVLFIISIKKRNRVNVEKLWAREGTGMILLRALFSYKRFLFLLRALRFDDITTRQEREKFDKLAAIRKIFEDFVKNYMESYSFGEFITIDEMLHPFRGRCGFVQYMPLKPAKYGIKFYALCDSKTYYTWKFEIYCELQREVLFKTSNLPFDIVQRLVEPIKNTKRNIITLAQYLLKNGITLTGIVKKK
ncbi:piggyBac transposable element-derived protein 4-like [Anthonomus grandis grandis]|uniref:piggyBac transposable element-derived protein 4-like n=1 Tax=Anthonomus grandis grandis TaxID=2921223 RepID=UPI0021663B93|nr:piggyBac transposable element-derived protein 4-like [Anthonomus grandis grandis]